MGEVVKILLKTFEEHFQKQIGRDEKRADEDYDAGIFLNYNYLFYKLITNYAYLIDTETQLEEEDDEDVFVLARLGDLIHSFFEAYKEAMLPVFDQLLPAIAKLLVDLNLIFFLKFV